MKKTVYLSWAVVLRSIVGLSCFLAASSASAVLIPASEDQAFNDWIRSYIAEAKLISNHLRDLIRTAETVPNVIYVYPITSEEKTWHYSGDRTRSHTDPTDSKRRGAARNQPTNSSIYINVETVAPDQWNYGRGTLIHELVHALDLALGIYNADYTIREKRAGFFENMWREHHEYPIRTNYADRFPVREYQRVKGMGRIDDFVFYHYRNNDIPYWAE